MTQAQTPSLKDRVQSIIDQLRPYIQSDGGDIELIDVTPDGTVSIRFQGACIGCPSSEMTLKMGIERNLKEKIPEIREVIPVND